MPLNISKHLDKDNLHHAYLIEAKKEEVFPEVLEFLKNLKIKTIGNPDFIEITLDSFKVENARNLKTQTNEKGISNDKKIFIICVNSIALEAQNTMLKLFEEPIKNTHFFVIVPDADSLLRTLISRFYVIKTDLSNVSRDAENFIKSSIPQRINFIKELLAEDDTDEDLSVDSSRSKAKVFLNSLEFTLHAKIFSNKSKISDVDFFSQIFKVREFLRQPGSSTKNLMEAIALSIPTNI